MTIKILTLAPELKELRSKWQTLSIYEKFEQLVVALLTAVIALIVALAKSKRDLFWKWLQPLDSRDERPET